MSNRVQEELLEELERELTWRTVEFVQIENILNEKREDEEFCGTYRKMLIIMLYSYFEGYCKSAFSMYVEYLNNLNLPVREVTDGLACSSLSKEFNKLFDSNYKPIDLGDRSIKDDSILQTYGRRREFVSQYVPYLAKTVAIPDDVVDMESNLKSHVLKKILCRLDMDFRLVEEYQKEINDLVNLRNAFAHGQRQRIPDGSEYNKYKTKAFGLMRKVKEVIYEHFYNGKYLKSNAIDRVSAS
jgi:hypothetical protein